MNVKIFIKTIQVVYTFIYLYIIIVRLLRKVMNY